MVDAAFGLLDQRAGDAAPAEIAGEREPDRAGADDQDGGVGGGQINPPSWSRLQPHL